MLDHIGLRTKDYATAKRFYTAALAPLGYQLVMEFGPEDGLDYQGAGFGVGGKPDFWIGVGQANGPVHVAFSAANRQAVDAFHAAALAAGGKDNGLPGPREHYHPNYYGAFVLDLDGNNVEAVCHRPG
ncbi:MAG TPA: VOC family protein [Myxococcaceae bacterium]|nr:VOC family protein [Myxococcaceae bacterium]